MYEKQFQWQLQTNTFFHEKITKKKGQSFSKNIPQALGEVMATWSLW
jgi:hypothetical protein